MQIKHTGSIIAWLLATLRARYIIRYTAARDLNRKRVIILRSWNAKTRRPSGSYHLYLNPRYRSDGTVVLTS